MNGEKYNSKRAPQAVGLYPHARKVGNLLFLSGVGPRVVNEQKIPGVELNKEGGIASYDIAKQCHSCKCCMDSMLEVVDLDNSISSI